MSNPIQAVIGQFTKKSDNNEQFYAHAWVKEALNILNTLSPYGC